MTRHDVESFITLWNCRDDGICVDLRMLLDRGFAVVRDLDTDEDFVPQSPYSF